MKGKGFGFLGVLVILLLVAEPETSLKEFDTPMADSDSISNPVLLKLELLSWNASLPMNPETEKNVYFQICGEPASISNSCFDSRVWTNVSSLDRSWSAVHYLDNMGSLSNLSIECIYFEQTDLQSNRCDLNPSEDFKIYFDLTNMSEEWMINLNSSSDTQDRSSWTLSSQPLSEYLALPLPYEHYGHCPNWSEGWNQLVVNGCMASESIDSDNDTYSDAMEVRCHTNLQDTNHTPDDLDGDTICDYIDIDADNDDVRDIGMGPDDHPLYIDECIEILSYEFIDLDQDGCSRISNDSDIDGDGIANDDDACMTLKPTNPSALMKDGYGCPGPSKFALRYLIVAILCTFLFVAIRNQRILDESLFTGDKGREAYLKTVLSLDKMYPSAIIKLGRQLNLKLSGNRKQKGNQRKRLLVTRAIDLILHQRKIRRTKVLGSFSTCICLFFISSMIISAGLTLFIQERDENLVIKHSTFHPTWWDIDDYQHYFADGIKSEEPPLIAIMDDPLVLLFDDNRTTHNSIFENHITTDCSKKEGGGYTVQADGKQSNGKYARSDCEFSISLRTAAASSIKILTEDAVMDGWFLTDPSINIKVNGENIESGSEDERLLKMGGPTGYFSNAGSNTISIDAALYSDDDQFHIVGIEVWGLSRGLVINQETSESLNAEILNGEKVISQLERQNNWMNIINAMIGTALVGLFTMRYLIISEDEGDESNNLIVLNKLLLDSLEDRGNTTKKMSQSEIELKISQFSDRELAYFAGELGIQNWNGRVDNHWIVKGKTRQYETVTKELLSKMTKKDLLWIFYNEESFNRKRVPVLSKIDGAVKKQTKDILVVILYQMIQRSGLEKQVVEILDGHESPQLKFEWFENEPWKGDGMNKRMELVTGETVPHSFPLKCGNKLHDNHDSVLHTIQTHKNISEDTQSSIDELSENPFTLLGTECTVKGCKSIIQLRTIPTIKIRINAKEVKK